MFSSIFSPLLISLIGISFSKADLSNNQIAVFPEIDCPGYKVRLERIGCYNENTTSDDKRTLPEQILNGRDKTSDVYRAGGDIISWKYYDDWIKEFTCDCAAKVLGNNNFMGIQFFGECWTGGASYDKYGVSDMCYNSTFGDLLAPEEPDQNSWYTGDTSTNFIYKVKGITTATNTTGDGEVDGIANNNETTKINGTTTATTRKVVRFRRKNCQRRNKCGRPLKFRHSRRFRLSRAKTMRSRLSKRFRSSKAKGLSVSRGYGKAKNYKYGKSK